MIEAPVLPCTHCGAALRATDPEAPVVRCDHCHGESPVSAQVRAAALAYRAAVKRELTALGLVEALRRGWGKSASERVQDAYLASMFALAGAFAVAVMALNSFDREDLVTWVAVGFVLFLLGSFAVLALAMRWAYFREVLDERSPPPPPPPRAVSGELAVLIPSACSACGAPVFFSVGASSVTCGHCRSTVLPTEPVKRRVITFTEFSTDLEAARRARDHARSLAISPFFDGLFWLVGRMVLLFPTALLWAGLFVVTEVVRPALPEYDSLLGMAPPAVAIPFGALLFGLALAAERAWQRRTPRYRAVQRLARHFHGQASVRGTRALFDWLDAHWAGPASEEALVFHNSDDGKPVRRFLAWFRFRGHATLVVLADAPHVRRFDLFLSVHDRRRESVPSPARTSELARAGLSLGESAAGFHVWAPSSDPAWCRPELIEWLLTTTLADTPL